MNTFDNMRIYMNLSRELLLGAIEDLLYKENALLKKNREYADTVARLQRSLKSCSVDSPDKGTDEFPSNYSAILDSHQQVIDSLENTLTMIARANTRVRGTHQAEPEFEVDPDVYSHIAGQIDNEAQKDAPTTTSDLSTEWFRAYPYAGYMPNVQEPFKQYSVFTFTDFPDGWLSKYPDLRCILGNYARDLSDVQLRIIYDIELNELSVRVAQ